MSEFCPEHSEMVEFRGAIKADVTHIKDTVNDISEKIDALSINNFTRDKHDAARTAALDEREKVAKSKEPHGWGYWVLIAACGGAGAWMLQVVLPQLFKVLAGIKP